MGRQPLPRVVPALLLADLLEEVEASVLPAFDNADFDGLPIVITSFPGPGRRVSGGSDMTVTRGWVGTGAAPSTRMPGRQLGTCTCRASLRRPGRGGLPAAVRLFCAYGWLTAEDEPDQSSTRPATAVSSSPELLVTVQRSSRTTSRLTSAIVTIDPCRSAAGGPPAPSHELVAGRGWRPTRPHRRC